MTASARTRRRRPLPLRGAVAACAAALVALSAPLVLGTGVAPAAAAAAAAVTVTGTHSGDHAWDPATGAPFADVPTVTVDQAVNLTDQVVHVTWEHFTPSDNGAGSFFSGGATYYAVTVLECKGTDPVDPTSWSWPDFGTDCYAHTPDDDSADRGVGNEAYSITGPDGSGETYFHVEAAQANDFLGCSATQACSLVVVPNWGGQQPAGSAPGSRSVSCTKHSGDTSFRRGNYALDTDLGAACSWSDRIVVPLSFAPTPDSCPSTDFQFASEGAPMLARTLQQWQAGWCTGSDALSFDYDSGTNEYLARSGFLGGSGVLSSSTDVAIVNQPASATAATARRFTYAPVTNTGIAIAYHVDDQHTGKLIDNLVLNARLVAKLITQSYSLDFDCTQGTDHVNPGPNCDPAVKGNPQDIFDDPEFAHLNPGYERTDFPAVSLLNRGQFLPLVISGNSDLVHELTRWVASDADARAFLSGTPDPYGMRVNTFYKSEPFPLDQFEVLDPGYTAPASGGVPGAETMQWTWNFLSGMTNVVSSLVVDRPSAISPTLPSCGSAGVPCVYPRFGSQPPGNRALFAVVGLPDAAANRFPTARLVNAAGTAVGPTDDALSTALAHLHTNPDGITGATDLATKITGQYPLTTVEYAMVPTCGLTAGKAAAIKQFLKRVTTSQTVGQEPGELAVGDLPLTAAEKARTTAAAAAVSSTPCPHSTGGGGSTHHGGSGGGGTGGTGNGAFGGTGGGSTTGTGTRHPPATTPSSSAAPSIPGAGSSPAPAALAGYGIKHADSNANPGLVLPILLVVVALLIVGGPGALILVRTGAGAALARRVTGLRGRR